MAFAKGSPTSGSKSANSGPAGRLLGPLVAFPAPLVPFATMVSASRGRLYPETESATRTCYSRDRDRIIHSSAFRRLKHKTQVFVEHEGDYYRTRLTHSLEVAQLARSLARSLRVDEDLAETVALAHDLGHTPFGHAGEDALAAVTADIGGFDHNAHALRLVTKLEHRYADFDGLNLTWETLEGLVKHNGPLLGPLRPSHLIGATGVGSLGREPPPTATASQAGEDSLPGPIAGFDARWPLDLSGWPGLEAQIAALADDIAYVNHDLDDGLRAGLFSIADLRDAPLAGPHVRQVSARYGDLELSRFIGEMIRTLMSALLDDLRAETAARLAAAKPESAAAVRAHPQALVALSPPMLDALGELKKFLFTHMYKHPRVIASMTRAKAVITDLYEAFCADPALLPQDWQNQCDSGATGGVVRDYIAGMTDTYALTEYSRVFHTEILL
jgi:dGTPase